MEFTKTQKEKVIRSAVEIMAIFNLKKCMKPQNQVECDSVINQMQDIIKIVRLDEQQPAAKK